MRMSEMSEMSETSILYLSHEADLGRRCAAETCLFALAGDTRQRKKTLDPKIQLVQDLSETYACTLATSRGSL